MFYFDNSFTAYLAPNCLEARQGRHIIFLLPNNIRYINNLELVAHAFIKFVCDFKNETFRLQKGKNHFWVWKYNDTVRKY